ncbi:MAG: GntR family transcriptional regulator [Planctomycetota bacterium]
MLQILIHSGDDLPIYRQIANQITDAIGEGRLVEGERLASHRDLAGQLVIAPLTVKKAYDTLEAEGLIRSVRGSGTFVAPQEAQASLGAEAWQARLRPPARRLLAQAALAGVSFTKLLELLREEKNELRQERASRELLKNQSSREKK